jgi:hypothetical protein
MPVSTRLESVAAIVQGFAVKTAFKYVQDQTTSHYIVFMINILWNGPKKWASLTLSSDSLTIVDYALNVKSIITNKLGNKLEPALTKIKLLPDLTPDSQVNQSKPDHIKSSIWFKFLANITRKRQNTLKQPLGEWILDFDQIRKRFTTYRTLTNLYKYRQDGIQNLSINQIADTE